MTKNRMIEMPLLIPVLAWISGIILGRSVTLPISVMLVVSIVLLFLSIFKKFRFYLILIVLLLTGILRFSLTKHLPENHIGNILKQHDVIVQSIKGRVISKITNKEGLSRFELELQEISGYPALGRIMFSCRDYSIKPFDIIETAARISRFSNAVNPASFDYREYQESRQIYGSGYALLSITNLGNDPPFFQSLIVKSQNYLQRQVELKCPQYAGFIRAVLLGDKRDAGDFRDGLNRAGLSHLLAVSGLHVGVVAFIFFTFFKIIIPNRLFARLLTIMALIFYAGICNWSPSVFRASVMISLFLLSKIISRKPQINNSLCAALLVITIFQPGQLFSIGLQLSFIAVITLVNVVPLLPVLPFNKSDSSQIKRVKNFTNILIRSVEVSLTLSLFLLPITAYYFHQINFNGVLANLIGIPLFAVLILPVAIVMILSPINIITIFYSDLFRILILGLQKWIEVVSKLGLHFDFIFFPAWKILPYYVSLLLLIWFIKHPRKLAFPISAVVILLLLFTGSKQQNEFKITCFDVGLGDLALMELPDGRNILIDSGPGEKSRGFIKNSAIPYMQENGINHLDWVVITHAHLDHYGGLGFLLEHNLVDTLVVTDDFMKRKIWGKFQKYNPNLKIISDTISTKWNNVKLKFLHPGEGYFSENINNLSLVLKVEYLGQVFLFTGDLESDGEAVVLRNCPLELDSDFLKVGHHGSRTASSDAFLKSVTPEVAVIST